MCGFSFLPLSEHIAFISKSKNKVCFSYFKTTDTTYIPITKFGAEEIRSSMFGCKNLKRVFLCVVESVANSFCFSISEKKQSVRACKSRDCSLCRGNAVSDGHATLKLVLLCCLCKK